MPVRGFQQPHPMNHEEFLRNNPGVSAASLVTTPVEQNHGLSLMVERLNKRPFYYLWF